MTDPTLDDLKKEATLVLQTVKASLQGLLIEIKGAQRRAYEASDFTIHEFKQLAAAIERLTIQLEKHK